MIKPNVACSVEGCDKRGTHKTMCNMHYSRFRKYGDVHFTKNRPDGEKLQWLTDIVECQRGNPSSACIVWPFGLVPAGYGDLHYKGKGHTSHRVALILFTGEDRIGMKACHGPCHNRPCCNPHHLYWGTTKQNTADTVRDGTWASRLTDSQVLDIRRLGESQSRQSIANSFGISDRHVGDIIHRRSWAWLK